jgi:hypothetical protein
MGLKKNHQRCWKCRDRHSKVNSKGIYKETDHYPTWSETRAALHSLRRTYHLLSDDGAEFFGLTTRSFKRMTFELATKMALPVHCQYNKEEQPGNDCVTSCAAILD